jgi:glutamate N-acetyltransferase/amino-acid N-acetyltransferase
MAVLSHSSAFGREFGLQRGLGVAISSLIFRMKQKLKIVEGSIVAPQGFLASGVFCDIKRLGTGKGSQKGKKRDLALIVSEVPATVAGMFTTNQVCAAPVKLCVERVKKGRAQAIVVNSGNANACTGKQGIKDAREMTLVLADELRLPESQVLVGSTGRIGVTMPMANVTHQSKPFK